MAWGWEAWVWGVGEVADTTITTMDSCERRRAGARWTVSSMVEVNELIMIDFLCRAKSVD